jgi:REP element-mobilizing transposase RayT
MTRTIQQQFLFEDPTVREWIYKHILRVASLYYVDLHAVTVMSNHYHIVLSVRKPVPDEQDLQERFERAHADKRHPPAWAEWRTDRWYAKLTDLSEFMKDLNASIARHMNAATNGKGHVWGGRYKSVVIEDGPGLLACMAYVELNPVRAGICERPQDYRWCSAGRFHQGGKTVAGVVIPPMSAFHGFQETKRQKGFYLLVNHLADRERGMEGHFTCDLAELEAIIDKTDMTVLADLTVRRTRWMIDSMVLGSKAFCAEVIERFRLQPGRLNGPEPYELSGGLFNSHRRAGPFLT